MLRALPTPPALRILLTAALRWPIAARLAISFAELGCHVEVLCPRQHPAAVTRAVRGRHAYSVLRPLHSLRAAIESSVPDLIITCDDIAAEHLHRLYELAHSDGQGSDGQAAHALRGLIARSLGSPEACAVAASRGQLMALAAAEGIRVPATTAISTASALNAELAQRTFPAVIKLDRTWGGQGVAIVPNAYEARRAFARMVAQPTIRNAMARLLLDRNPHPFLDLLSAAGHAVTLQDYICGAPANRAVACWRGEVLAGISVEAIKTQHATGPATVVRVIENDEMSEAATRLVRRLGLSGLWGIDFVLEASTGAAYVVELNPRATPICHLPLGERGDLPAALYTRLTGSAPAIRPTTIAHDVIALFPGEWRRNPASAYLHSAFQDVPWDEPALALDLVDRPWSERGLIARLWTRLRKEIKSAAVPAGERDAPARSGCSGGGARCTGVHGPAQEAEK